MEMEEEEGIGLVLARATELRLKISNCIEKATTSKNPFPRESQKEVKEEGFVNGEKNSDSLSEEEMTEEEYQEEEEEEEEEAERLVHIRDALESLETQLVALQNLRQRQQYERQVALAEIDCSRKVLLEKLKDYKGMDLEVIKEASAFAGEKVEYDNDLLLPPYPSRPPQSLVLDNGYLSCLTSKHKTVQNGSIIRDPKNDATKNLSNSERNQAPGKSEKPRKGFGHIIGSIARTVLPVIGIISILRMSGLGPELGKRSISLKNLGLFQQPVTEEKKSTVQCPPGKVLVVENGEARCLVKERVEIPFESIVAKQDVNYGYG